LYEDPDIFSFIVNIKLISSINNIIGLNGGSRSIYLRHTANELRRRMRVKCVAMNYRGTNGTELLVRTIL